MARDTGYELDAALAMALHDSTSWEGARDVMLQGVLMLLREVHDSRSRSSLTGWRGSPTRLPDPTQPVPWRSARLLFSSQVARPPMLFPSQPDASLAVSSMRSEPRLPAASPRGLIPSLAHTCSWASRGDRARAGRSPRFCSLLVPHRCDCGVTIRAPTGGKRSRSSRTSTSLPNGTGHSCSANTPVARSSEQNRHTLVTRGLVTLWAMPPTVGPWNPPSPVPAAASSELAHRPGT
jgi:hypothetical protein